MELNVEEILNSFNNAEPGLLSSSSKLQKANEMRKAIKFCDLTLKINDKDEFKVHKTIIASSCQYFAGMLTGDWVESNNDVISLDYKIKPECFEKVLEYLYTGKLEITKISFENAKIIHEAAVFFNLLILKDVMSRILEKFISNENVLELWRHGVKFFDKNLQEKCVEYIFAYSAIFFKKNVEELKFSELESLYGNNKLKWSHEEFYENLIKWVKFDFDSREKHLKDFLNLINFSKISGKFIQSKMLRDEMLHQNEDFRNRIMRELTNGYNIRLQTKVTENKIEKLGILLISNTGIFQIDLETKKCLPLLNHKINRKNFEVNKFGFNNILISGGENSNFCEYYSPNLNLVEVFPPMLEKRWGHSVISSNNKIYAFGGYDSDTMEIFDINTGTWNYGPKMPRKRWGFILTENDGVFTLWAGCDGTTMKVVPCDQFDIKTGCWKNSTVDKITEDNTQYCGSETSIYEYRFIDCSLRKILVYNQRLSSFATVTFKNIDFIFGKQLNSDKFYSTLFDPKNKTLKDIQIDVSQCGDIGDEYHLETAYL